jgi:microcin C transport system substrate-binding protein
MVGFIFNTRRAIFADWRVRRALGFVFDFEWTNANIFYGAYKRTKSYFERTELAARGLPGGAELALLERFRGRVPDRVFEEAYALPSFNGSGDIREGLHRAFALLGEAGFEVRDFKLVEKASGRPLRFEIMINESSFERAILPYLRNLRRLGVEARLRLVDPSQYIKRLQTFDFDVIYDGWGQSLSPGNEQRDFWSSAAANKEDSSNYAGIKDAAIDELIELVISAPDRESLVARTRALDRVLLAQHFIIPGWHLDYNRIAYWDKFGLPPGSAFAGIPPTSWWVDAGKAERLKGRIRSLGTR